MRQSIEVMVLDDEPIVCERLKDFLEKNGLYVETFTESPTALKRLEEKAFDVVITDLKMQGPTGLDVLLHIKREQLPSQVIMMTGYGSFEEAREAEAVGVWEFIPKPFQLTDMLKQVKKAAKRAKKARGAR